MTTQEAAQRIWDWFVVDGNPPGIIPGTTDCNYRTPSGARCAAGCLIPDELYHPELEGKTSKQVSEADPRIRAYWGEADDDFIRDAQYDHDCAVVDDAWSTFGDHFLATCERYGVTIDRRGK